MHPPLSSPKVCYRSIPFTSQDCMDFIADYIHGMDLVIHMEVLGDMEVGVDD